MSNAELNKNSLDSINTNNIAINNLNVNYFVNNLNDKLKGGYIQKVQMLDTPESFMKIKINTKQKNEILIIGEGMCIITKYNPDSRSQNKGFSLNANRILDNKKIISIVQKNSEKIIEFEFPDLYLICELFSHNNIILTDKEYNIIDCLVKEEWKDRIIKPKQKYLLPGSTLTDPIKYKFNKDDFDSSINLVSNIIKLFNVSPGFVEVIINEKGIDKNKFNIKDAEYVVNKIKDVITGNTVITHTLIYSKGKTEFFNYDFDSNLLTKIDLNLNDILDELIIKNKITEKNDVLKTQKKKNVDKINDILKSQEKKLNDFDKKSVQEKIKGDLIYANYNDIEDIVNVVNNARLKGESFEKIEQTLLENKQKIKKLEIFKGINKKSKKIIFNLRQQQAVSHQQ